jgi:phage tail-like protein
MALPGVNAAFAVATNLLGIRLDPYQVFNFFIEIDGLLVGGFSECSGLQVEVEVENYPEGGVNDYVHHFKGRAKYPPLVLKHGLSLMEGLWSWHQDVIQGEFERLNGTIYLLNRMQIPVLWWDFKEAFPTKWTGPELRADSGNVAFESVELVHKGLSRPKGAGVLAGFGAELL